MLALVPVLENLVRDRNRPGGETREPCENGLGLEDACSELSWPVLSHICCAAFSCLQIILPPSLPSFSLLLLGLGPCRALLGVVSISAIITHLSLRPG